MKHRHPKVTVLYNEITSLQCKDEQAILSEQGAKDDAKIVAKALSVGGYKAETFKLTRDNIRELSKIKTNLFFNLCDGIGNLPKTEHKVPEILDSMKLPYTGANASSLILTTNKALTKKIFEQNNIPTPAYAVFETVPDSLPDGLGFPLFVKPVAEDCSLGIETDSFIKNISDLQKKVKNLLIKYQQPVLVEEYISGRELNVTIIGNGKEAKILPISEIIFGKFYVGKKKFMDFKAKWLENSMSYRNTVGWCPAEISKRLGNKIEKLALRAYFACGGRDYARIDIRVDRNNTPYFLEVNLNCDISPEMGAFRSAKVGGLSYPQFIGKLALFASKRYEDFTS